MAAMIPMAPRGCPPPPPRATWVDVHDERRKDVARIALVAIPPTRGGADQQTGELKDHMIPEPTRAPRPRE